MRRFSFCLRGKEADGEIKTSKRRKREWRQEIRYVRRSTRLLLVREAAYTVRVGSRVTVHPGEAGPRKTERRRR